MGSVEFTPLAPTSAGAHLNDPVSYFLAVGASLAVHGLDLARALHLQTPDGMPPAITAALELAGTLGGQLPSAPDLLLLLTGRDDLPKHLSVL